MQLVTYAESIHDLGVLAESSAKEVILSSDKLGRIAKTKHSELNDLIKEAKHLGLKVILEWDILLTENDFETSVNDFLEIDLNFVDGIRVQDAGIMEYVFKNTDKDIYLILETGNHNLTGIKAWQSYLGERLKRVILSIELNKDKLKLYRENLDCEIELLTLGRILLFYSPRKLLSPLVKEEIQKKYIEALGESEESPHKGFPLIENRHGTFMFHIKNLFLFDKYEDLLETKIDYARVDLRDHDIKLISEISNITDNESGKSFKESYGKDVIRGYFHINKSDILFKKLKNYRIQRKDDSYIGEVLEASKSDYMAIFVRSKSPLNLNDQLKFITPEGKEHFCKVHSLKNANYEDQQEVKFGELALINYMSGVWSKSQVYFDTEN